MKTGALYATVLYATSPPICNFPVKVSQPAFFFYSSFSSMIIGVLSRTAPEKHEMSRRHPVPGNKQRTLVGIVDRPFQLQKYQLQQQYRPEKNRYPNKNVRLTRFGKRPENSAFFFCQKLCSAPSAALNLTRYVYTSPCSRLFKGAVETKVQRLAQITAGVFLVSGPVLFYGPATHL